MREKILLLEAIHPGAKHALEKEGHEVTLVSHSPEGAELDALLKKANSCWHSFKDEADGKSS